MRLISTPSFTPLLYRFNNVIGVFGIAVLPGHSGRAKPLRRTSKKNGKGQVKCGGWVFHLETVAEIVYARIP